jgi:hypothetical protein
VVSGAIARWGGVGEVELTEEREPVRRLRGKAVGGSGAGERRENVAECLILGAGEVQTSWVQKKPPSRLGRAGLAACNRDEGGVVV